MFSNLDEIEVVSKEFGNVIGGRLNNWDERSCIGDENFWVGHQAAFMMGAPLAGQCDANPLVGESCRQLVEAGGTALLAETDELIGAEQYVLQSVADFRTATRFLELVPLCGRLMSPTRCSLLSD